MIDNDIPKYAALLKMQYLFQGLDEAQLAHVVVRFERIDLALNTLIFPQGAFEDGFYLIFRGSVRVTRQEGNQERPLEILGPGDFFGEESLLFERARDTSIRTVDTTVLLRLGREDFFDLIQQFPQIKMNLSATAESRYLAHKVNFEWLGEDEVIYLITRKHEFVLVTSLFLPIFVGIVSIPMFLFGLSVESSFMSNLGVISGILGFILSIGWTAWRWIDWGNDYYIVTNQKVVWQERIIGLYSSRREAPLVQVLAVNIKKSWVGRILNFGNIDVRTFTGSILMRSAANPGQFAYFIDSFQVRAQHLAKESEAAKREQVLRQRLGLGQSELLSSVSTGVDSEGQAGNKKVKPGSLSEKLETFMQVRYEREGVITYRKHWMLLLRKTWLPSFVFILSLIMTALLIRGGAIGDLSTMGLFLICLVGMSYIGIALWWVYNYVDWSNDIYQLTPDQILDIERKPLGDEQKKSAPLDSILSLEHSRDGIIQLLLNYGNVIINVGQTKFVFRGVYNPDQVHQDVSDYIEARKRREAQNKAQSERENLADWFITYRKQSDFLEPEEDDTGWDLFPG